MSVNSIHNAATTYESRNTAKSHSTNGKSYKYDNQTNVNNDATVVYQKEKASKTSYKTDRATVDRMIAEAERSAQTLRDLVERMLLKQGETLQEATDIYALLREGKLPVDPETRAQAQKDIAEDGYWGVEQTSDRLVSFAKALTGGDPSKADDMIAAVKKGFESATRAWGDELPELCKKTLEAAIGKLEAWKAGTQEDQDIEQAADSAFRNQATMDYLAR